MAEKTTEELRQVQREFTRKMIEEKTWPQVVAVFIYPNEGGMRTSDADFEKLATSFKEAGYPNLAKFVEAIRFVEAENNGCISLNLSMIRRSKPGDAKIDDDPTAYFSSPDLMIGTRRGVEGAADWLKKLDASKADMDPQSLQFFDCLVSEALPFWAGPSKELTMDQLARVATGEESLTRLDVPRTN